MNAKDKVQITDEAELIVTTPLNKLEGEKKLKAYAAAAGVSVQELKNTMRGSMANYPCPKCGSESKRHQGPEGEDRKNPTRICSAATCRTVFKG